MYLLQPGQQPISGVVGLIEQDDEGIEVFSLAEVASIAVDAGQRSGLQRDVVFGLEQAGVGLEAVKDGQHRLRGDAGLA